MADKLRFRYTSWDDIWTVARNMRAADVAEVEAMGLTPSQALTSGMANCDECITVMSHNGVLLAIYGVAPGCELTGMGRPWLLGTDELFNHKRELMTIPHKIIGLMLAQYPRLENYVHVKNRTSVRWLKFLGFKMDDPVMMPSGEEFMRFHMVREDYV